MPVAKFTSENAPRQGGKPGRVMRGPLKTAIKAKLDKLFEKATVNVAREINKGSASTSMWFLEFMAKQKSSHLERRLTINSLTAKLERLEDLVMISRQAVQAGLEGELGFDEVKAIQEMLARHSVIEGMLQLKQMREEIDKIGRELGDTSPLGLEHVPTWGRLKVVGGSESGSLPPSTAPTNGHASNGHANGHGPSLADIVDAVDADLDDDDDAVSG